MLHLHFMEVPNMAHNRTHLTALLRHSVDLGTSGIACLTGASSVLMAHLRQSLPITFVCKWHSVLNPMRAAYFGALFMATLCMYLMLAWVAMRGACDVMHASTLRDETCVLLLTPIAFVLACALSWLSIMHFFDRRMFAHCCMDVDGCGYCISAANLPSNKLFDPRQCHGVMMNTLSALHENTQIRVRMVCFRLPKCKQTQAEIVGLAMDMIRESAIDVVHGSPACSVMHVLNPRRHDLQYLGALLQDQGMCKVFPVQGQRALLAVRCFPPADDWRVVCASHVGPFNVVQMTLSRPPVVDLMHILRRNLQPNSRLDQEDMAVGSDRRNPDELLLGLPAGHAVGGAENADEEGDDGAVRAGPDDARLHVDEEDGAACDQP